MNEVQGSHDQSDPKKVTQPFTEATSETREQVTDTTELTTPTEKLRELLSLGYDYDKAFSYMNENPDIDFGPVVHSFFVGLLREDGDINTIYKVSVLVEKFGQKVDLASEIIGFEKRILDSFVDFLKGGGKGMLLECIEIMDNFGEKIDFGPFIHEYKGIILTHFKDQLWNSHDMNYDRWTYREEELDEIEAKLRPYLGSEIDEIKKEVKAFSEEQVKLNEAQKEEVKRLRLSDSGNNDW